jgi:hypothetical protein
MNFRVVVISFIALAGCGDASQDAGTQSFGSNQTSPDLSTFAKVETSGLSLSDLLIKTNWEVLDNTNWTDNSPTTEFCISWKFVHPNSFKVSSVGSFLLMKGLVEQKEDDSYIYDCSNDLKTYKLYLVEKTSGAKSLISTITRVAKITNNYPTTASSSWTPTPTPTPVPVWTPTPTPAPTSAKVVFSVYQGGLTYTRNKQYSGSGIYQTNTNTCTPSYPDIVTVEKTYQIADLAKVQSKFACTLSLIGGKYYCDVVGSYRPYSTCTCGPGYCESNKISYYGVKSNVVQYLNCSCYPYSSHFSIY